MEHKDFLIEQCRQIDLRIATLISLKDLDDNYKMENVEYLLKLKYLYEKDLNDLNQRNFPINLYERFRQKRRRVVWVDKLQS